MSLGIFSNKLIDNLEEDQDYEDANLVEALNESVRKEVVLKDERGFLEGITTELDLSKGF